MFHSANTCGGCLSSVGATCSRLNGKRNLQHVYDVYLKESIYFFTSVRVRLFITLNENKFVERKDLDSEIR